MLGNLITSIPNEKVLKEIATAGKEHILGLRILLILTENSQQ